MTLSDVKRMIPSQLKLLSRSPNDACRGDPVDEEQPDNGPVIWFLTRGVESVSNVHLLNLAMTIMNAKKAKIR